MSVWCWPLGTARKLKAELLKWLARYPRNVNRKLTRVPLITASQQSQVLEPRKVKKEKKKNNNSKLVSKSVQEMKRQTCKNESSCRVQPVMKRLMTSITLQSVSVCLGSNGSSGVSGLSSAPLCLHRDSESACKRERIFLPFLWLALREKRGGALRFI